MEAPSVQSLVCGDSTPQGCRDDQSMASSSMKVIPTSIQCQGLSAFLCLLFSLLQILLVHRQCHASPLVSSMQSSPASSRRWKAATSSTCCFLFVSSHLLFIIIVVTTIKSIIMTSIISTYHFSPVCGRTLALVGGQADMPLDPAIGAAAALA